MKIRSFFMALVLVMISPVLSANSSWQDIKADVKLVKDSLVKKISFSPVMPSQEVPTVSFPAINSADVFVASIPSWAAARLWYKGFNFCKPFQSTKTMFNLRQEMTRMEFAKLALNNKAYVGKLALKNGAKVAGAAYLTGFGWHFFGKNK